MAKPNTMDDLKQFMGELGYEYHDSEYYKCFIKDEGTCELTLDGAKQLYKAFTAKLQEVDRAARIDELKHIEPPEQMAEYEKLLGREGCIICGFSATQWSRYIQDRLNSLKGGDV